MLLQADDLVHVATKMMLTTEMAWELRVASAWASGQWAGVHLHIVMLHPATQATLTLIRHRAEVSEETDENKPPRQQIDFIVGFPSLT